MLHSNVDYVFCLNGLNGETEWYAKLNGRNGVYHVGPFNDKGAAMAGLKTEQRRAEARKQESH